MNASPHSARAAEKASAPLCDEIRRLHGQGLRQRQIALRLGISQATVSTLKSQMERGVTPTPARRVRRAEIADAAGPASTSSRAEILVEQATLKAQTLETVTRTLLDHIVGADEWVTDPDYPTHIRTVAGSTVRAAIDRLEQVVEQLRLASSDTSGEH